MKRSRSFITCAVLLATAFALALCLIPQFLTRVKNESANRTVKLSVLYSDLKNRQSEESLPGYLDKFKAAGATVVSLPEDAMNILVSRGDITGLRYHDVRHRYDTEGAEVETLLEGVSGLKYNSHVFIVKRQNIEARLDEWLPLYYTNADYIKAGHAADAAVYVFFDPGLETYDIPVGYDEDALSLIHAHGLDIALVLRAGAHGSTGYIDKMAELIEKYNVRYLNLKKDSFSKDGTEAAKKNVEGIVSLVRGGLTLVVTENDDQLSNVRPIGYDEIFDAADGRVMRSYETYDHSQADETGYMFRFRNYMNSILDRNIRFVTVTQLALGGKSSEELADDTVRVVEETVDHLSKLGFSTEGEVSFSYETGKHVPALAASFTALCAFAALAALFGLGGAPYTAAALAVSACAFGASFIMPRSLVLLYPTALALVMPCLAVALAFSFVKQFGRHLGALAVAGGTAAVMLFVVMAGGFVMASLTSGLDYYVNNDIFRGIKLSLYAPLIFAAASYYVMFVHEKGALPGDIKAAMTAKVSVWWCVAAAALALVSFIYIRRSGNVNSISAVEAAMRNFMTDNIAARPRTKEFIVAYPCIVLFARHFCRGGKLIPWISAVGAAILPASVMNTFCHVFTDVRIQYGRVLNGLLIGLLTAAAVFFADMILTRIYDGRVGKAASLADK